MKQRDLYVNNLVGDVKANPGDFYRYINSQKKSKVGRLKPPPVLTGGFKTTPVNTPESGQYRSILVN